MYCRRKKQPEIGPRRPECLQGTDQVNGVPTSTGVGADIAPELPVGRFSF